MSKLNAFLASVPANGLPSPSAQKCMSPGPQKAFPSLAIPSRDDDEMTSEVFQQPATPQPALSRRMRQARSSNSTRDIARKFDSQRALALSSTRDADEDPVDPADPSNQEEADDKTGEPRAAVAIEDIHVSTPMKRRIMTPLSSQPACKPAEESESSPLKRLNMAHQHLHHQHHRRVSTDTAMFSKLLKKKPDEHINTEVVTHFDRLTVQTVSRPDQRQNNQLEEDDQSRGTANAFDVTDVVSAFKRGETIPVAHALDIVQRATNAMNVEANVVSVQAPITIVGDLHGQFSDLIEIFRVHGAPSPKNAFLFLGDYVDRGVSSCEIILSLLSFKVAHPNSVYLLRGNHECRSLSTFYGFRAECLKKYGLAVYNRTIKCFEAMPLAARLTTSYGTFLAVHGGLSPNIQFVEEINDKVNRFVEPEPSGALCDLLWSDPAKDTQKQSEPWAHNGVRGCSYTFNESVCREFLDRNGLLAIIRAHELEADGYREHFLDKTRKSRSSNDAATPVFPPVITVFSAPEYCNTNKNRGATLVIPWELRNGSDSAGLLDYRQHGRSAQREFEFGGPSEAEAVSAYLRDQLPFLPVDFYELVALCRQLRATLDVAASVPTPVPSSASNVLREKSVVGKEELALATESKVSFDGRQDGAASQDDSTTEIAEAPVPIVTESVVQVVSSNDAKTKSNRKQPQVPRRRASTGGTFRLCPGFIRFCEKFLGIHFPDSPPQSSADDLEAGSSTRPATSPNSPETGVVASIAECRRVNTSRPMSATAAPSASQTKSSFRAGSNVDIFTPSQWSALRLYFALLDIAGSGVLMEESFVILLAEQDGDAYATQEELELLMDVFDCNGDGLITTQDFLQFAYRAFLHWTKRVASVSPSPPTAASPTK
ncbi:hypothetical protein PINS_up010112 [Pythium insidiosum]|nr:hypothetical protein PINS_up010112 [Pythium insidiosum]